MDSVLYNFILKGLLINLSSFIYLYSIRLLFDFNHGNGWILFE